LFDRLLNDIASYQSFDIPAGSISYKAFRAYVID